jgi:hypothetical protein
MRLDRRFTDWMRLSNGHLLALGLCPVFALTALAPAALATDSNLTPRSNKGTDHIQGVPYDGGRLQGDTIEDPFIITGSFFSGTGNTCGFANNYEEMCPYSSNSPDVVYKYTPDMGLDLRIDLCSSTYDTKVFVYDFEAGYGFGHPLACNDDAGCGITGYQSRIDFATQAGRTYYIVVDGYSGDCGDYTLDIYEIMIEVVECPAGGRIEGEPDCHDDYDDTFNGGCNSTPPVFTYLTGTPQGERFDVCGKSGTFFSDMLGNRETDWYQLDVSQTNGITFACVAEFPLQIYMLDGNAGCSGVQILDSATAYPFEVVSRTRTFAPGTYWFWVGPSVYGGVPCGADYVMSITGYTSGSSGVPEESPDRGTTWGAVKSAFN